MELKNQLDKVLSKRMNRKDFLIQAGAALMALVGITNVLRQLGGSSPKQHSTRSNYGGGAYGGKGAGVSLFPSSQASSGSATGTVAKPRRLS